MNTLATTRLLGATLGMLVLTACGDRGGAGAAGEEGGEPERGGTAGTVELADINRPVPLIEESSLDGQVQGMLFLGLLGTDWGDGRLIFKTADEDPLALARRYEFAGPDSTILRYHMRSDVRWSDGTPVTARDVVFTYTIIKDPQFASPRQDFAEYIRSVVAENDSTVAFQFTRRYPEMLYHTGLGILPAHVYENVSPGEIRTHPSVTDPVNAMVTNGPFRIGAWQKGAQITLVPNPGFRPQAYLDQVVIRVIPEATTRVVEMSTGSVDMISGVTFDQVRGLQAQAPHARIVPEKRRNYEYIGYNPKAHPAFADPEIRRALSHALNVPGMIEALEMGEFAEPAGGPYPPIFTRLYDPQGQAPVAYDTARAKQILDAKGWRDTNGNGIRDRAGREFRFTLATNTGNQRRADVMQIVQQQWRAIGVDVQLQPRETNTFFDDLTDRNYDAALTGWAVALAPDLTGVWSPGNPFNFVDYENPELVRVMDQALNQPTEEAAAPLWRQAASIISRDQPYTFLYFYDTVNAVHQRLRGVKIDPLGHYQNLWEWWIPRSQQRGGPAAPVAGDSATE